MQTTTTLTEIILNAASDIDSLTQNLQSLRAGTVEDFNAASGTNFSAEEFTEALDNLDDGVKYAWLARMEDAATAGLLSFAATYDNDRDMPVYERFMSPVSLDEVEEATGMTVEEAQERIASDGTLF